MGKDDTITLVLLKETGFTTWFDFVFNITGYSGSNGVYTYSYARDNDAGKISLNITRFVLERMALEEAKLILPLINVPSFSQFKQLVLDRQMQQDKEYYKKDVVVRKKDQQIVLKRLKFQVREIEQLVEWEEKYENEFVFIETGDK